MLAEQLKPPENPWRKMIDALRAEAAGPSSFRQLAALTQRMRDGDDLEPPPMPPPPAATGGEQKPRSHRGAKPIHDWEAIKKYDREWCCQYVAKHHCAPHQRERYRALQEWIGVQCAPHWKTMWKHLPKQAPL